MPQWKMFPLETERPKNLKPFRKKERDVLELTIAQQVADLLSRHGRIAEQEVDVSESLCCAEPQTYQGIELDDVPLEDDGLLIVGQFPYSSDGFWTNEGAHSVSKLDENGKLELSLAVWDPSIEAALRIHDARGKIVGRLLLQELYEALCVVLTQADANSAGNVPPLSTGDFPFPVIDPEFLALAYQFE